MNVLQRPEDQERYNDSRHNAHHRNGLTRPTDSLGGVSDRPALGSIAESATGQPYGLQVALWAYVDRCGAAAATDGTTSLGKVHPQAWEDAKASSEAEAHRVIPFAFRICVRPRDAVLRRGRSGKPRRQNASLRLNASSALYQALQP